MVELEIGFCVGFVPQRAACLSVSLDLQTEVLLSIDVTILCRKSHLG